MRRMTTDRAPSPTARYTVACLVVVGLGLLLRLVVLAAGQGGLTTHVHPGYDESVYVGAAWLARGGALPYRDFVFVFPPGFLVLLLPVVQVASFFGGPALAVTLVRLLAAVAGAVNIWLVSRIGSRWLGPVGGLVAAVVYATLPLVVLAEASALQEPFVNLGVLLAVVVWAQRREVESTTARLLASGLLVGAAISIKLVAAVVVVAFLVAGPFVRPVADRVRWFVAVCLPLAMTGAVLAILVGWRPLFDQAVAAQVLRGRDGEGLSRVNSMLPFLRGQVGPTRFVGPGPWIAVALFAAACVVVVVRGGRAGRLWGAMGLVVLTALMASPSYYGHYGALLAPSLALVTAWVLVAAWSALRTRRILPAVAVGALLVTVVLAIATTQTVTVVDALPVRLGDLGTHLRQVVDDAGPPDAGRLSDAIARVPAHDCIVAIRPQLLLDVDRVPSADRDGHVLLDVYGRALLAASRADARTGEMPGAVGYPSVQATIVGQARDCARVVLARRTCTQGRKDLTRATEARLVAGREVVARVGCLELRRRVRGR